MFTDLLWMSLVAVGAPLVVALAPSLRIPAIVLEIVGGIIIGPQVLDIASADVHVRLLSSIGLAFLLFLAGRVVDLDLLRGPLAALAGMAFVVLARHSLYVGYYCALVSILADT